MSGDIELSIQGVYNRARWWSSSASDFGRLTVLALICRQQDLPKCWCLSTRRHVQEDLYLRSPLSSSLMARQSASRPSLFRNFTSRYPYLLLVSSMLLFSPTTRSPSWCHSISVLVFPEVFFHGILQPSTFSNLSEASLEPSWKFLVCRVGMFAPRPTLLFLDFGLSRNQQLRPRRSFRSHCPKEIQIPNCRHILGGKLDLLHCSSVCVVSGGDSEHFQISKSGLLSDVRANLKSVGI